MSTSVNKSINETRVILVGGSSHVGKSTLGYSLAVKLGWDYLATDSMARHPGRPWISAKAKTIPEHVVEHYRTLSVEALLLDVLSHYEKNVLPQIEVIVRSHAVDQSKQCLVLEGSALYPRLVANLVMERKVKAVWLTASEQLFQKRIRQESNFDNVGENEKYLIQKFMARTLLYDKCMNEDVEDLGFTCINVESTLDQGKSFV